MYREYKQKTAFYLDRTLRSLIRPLSKEDRKKTFILVILADMDHTKRIWVYNKLTTLFKSELEDGLIGVIGIPIRFYMPLGNLAPTFNDSSERMYWRSKQSLDYSFVFDYVKGLCNYYMQVEDDVLADDQYHTKIMVDIDQLNSERNKQKILFEHEIETRLKHKPWIVSEYYKMGFIGRLIPSHYLSLLSGFIRVYYNEIPVDWGYSHMIMLMGQKPVKYPSLFTHIGNQSSSSGTWNNSYFVDNNLIFL